MAAAAVARRWSDALPSDETAAVKWVRMLRLAGRPAEAAAAASVLTERWRREHGAEPPPELLDVRRQGDGDSDSGRAFGSADREALFTLPMVARATEFSVLSALWRQVSRGGGGVVLVEGEEGSGRTRLLSDFCNWTLQSGDDTLVLRTRAFGAEQGSDWSTLRHLLPALASAPGIAGAPPAVLAAIAREVPEFGERYRAPADAALPSLAEAVGRALADVGVERPILVAVDDAHLADGRSRALLEHLCRHPAPGTMLLMTAQRDVLQVGDIEHRPGGPPGTTHRMQLSSFSEAEVRELVAGMGSFDPADAAVITERIMSECGGNPLASTALLASLARAGALRNDENGAWRLVTSLPVASVPMPVSLRTSLASRIRQLDTRSRTTLEAAAVLGRDFDVASLRSLAGMPDQQLDEALRAPREPPDDRIDSRRRTLQFTQQVLFRVTRDGLAPTPSCLPAASPASSRRGRRPASAVDRYPSR